MKSWNREVCNLATSVNLINDEKPALYVTALGPCSLHHLPLTKVTIWRVQVVGSASAIAKDKWAGKENSLSL